MPISYKISRKQIKRKKVKVEMKGGVNGMDGWTGKGWSIVSVKDIPKK